MKVKENEKKDIADMPFDRECKNNCVNPKN